MNYSAIRLIVLLTAIIIFRYSSFSQNDSFTSIKIDLPDKIQLDARYYNPGTPGPGILLLCQCDPSTDQNEYNSLANKLKKVGYHVLSFDYRGFGNSEGVKPNLMSFNSIEEAMQYWRKKWLNDVEKAFNTLLDAQGVDHDRTAIVGASCGNFLALEYALKHRNIKTLTLLGGPVDDYIINRLKDYKELPIQIIAGNEGRTFEWVEKIFKASKNHQTTITKFKTISHGTGIFKKQPQTEKMILDWIKRTI